MGYGGKHDGNGRAHSNYEMIHGKDEVERFLDAVLAIQEHIDPSIIAAPKHQLRIE